MYPDCPSMPRPTRTPRRSAPSVECWRLTSRRTRRAGQRRRCASRAYRAEAGRASASSALRRWWAPDAALQRRTPRARMGGSGVGLARPRAADRLARRRHAERRTSSRSQPHATRRSPSTSRNPLPSWFQLATIRLTNNHFAQSTTCGQERRHRAQESNQFALDRSGLIGACWRGLSAMC